MIQNSTFVALIEIIVTGVGTISQKRRRANPK